MQIIQLNRFDYYGDISIYILYRVFYLSLLALYVVIYLVRHQLPSRAPSFAAFFFLQVVDTKFYMANGDAMWATCVFNVICFENVKSN